MDDVVLAHMLRAIVEELEYRSPGFRDCIQGRLLHSALQLEVHDNADADAEAAAIREFAKTPPFTD